MCTKRATIRQTTASHSTRRCLITYLPIPQLRWSHAQDNHVNFLIVGCKTLVHVRLVGSGLLSVGMLMDVVGWLGYEERDQARLAL